MPKEMNCECYFCKKKFVRKIFPSMDLTLKTFCTRKCYRDYEKESNTVVLDCGWCGKKIRRFLCHFKLSKTGKLFCNRECIYEFYKSRNIEKNCGECGKVVKLVVGRLKQLKTDNIFCSMSCSSIYWIKNGTWSRGVSQLELYLQKHLPIIYPDIYFKFNQRDDIGSELDIYLPDYKLGIEINGIFHYKQIKDMNSLERVQDNDRKKVLACEEKGIDFIAINTTSMNVFKEKQAREFLNAICAMIDYKIEEYNKKAP